MKKFLKKLACVAACAVFALSFAGCDGGLLIDKEEYDAAKAGKEAVLVINDEIEVSGAYYGYYYSSNYSQMYNEKAQAAEAEASSDAEASSSAEAPEIKLDQNEVKKKAIDQIVEIKLACKEAKKNGAVLNADDKKAIEAEIDGMKEQISQTGYRYSDYLETFMLTDSETFEQIVEDSYLASYYGASLVKDKFITAQHILISYPIEGAEATEGQSANREEALKKAQDIKKQLDEGADFDKLMNENSNDGRNADGTLANPDGYTFAKDGSMVPEFETAAFKLKEGEISDVVEVVSTNYAGFHIIKKGSTTISDVAKVVGSTMDEDIRKTVDDANASLSKDVKVVEKDGISQYDLTK